MGRHFGAMILPPFLFQAIGAALLTLMASIFFMFRSQKMALIGLLGVIALGGGAFICRGPILSYGRKIVDATSFGPSIRGFLRESSFGSFGWRLGLEERYRDLLKQSPWTGQGVSIFGKPNRNRFGLGVWLVWLRVPTASLDVQHGLR